MDNGENLAGSGYRPELIRSGNEAAEIRRLLAEKPRDLLLFDLVTLTDLPVKRILGLKVRELLGLNPGDSLSLGRGRGRGPARFTLTDELHGTWTKYVREYGPRQEEYVFFSRKGSEPLSLSSVSNMVRGWFQSVGVKDPGGVRRLRQFWKSGLEDGRDGLGSGPLETRAIKSLKPVKMVSVRESVYKGLLEAIVSGTIPPGERLNLDLIASQMGVSRMPVREALRQLQAAGFVSSQRTGAIVVNQLSRDDLHEIQEIRLTLESKAAKTAAGRRSEAAIRRLSSIHRRYGKALRSGQIERAIKHNREFHLIIYEEAGMPIMRQIIESLLDRISPYLHIELRGVDPKDLHIRSTIRNHEGILRGLKWRDPVEVVKWLEQDHWETTDRITKFFSESAEK